MTLLLKKTITDAVYQKKEAELLKQKAQFGVVIKNEPDKVQLLMDKATEYFDLAKDATIQFDDASKERKRYMTFKLGSNHLLKSKMFSVLLRKTFTALQPVSKELVQINKRLEPLKIPLNTREMGHLYAKNAIVRRRWDSNPRTLSGSCFQDRCNGHYATPPHSFLS